MHSREGMTQGYPLAMFAYGIDVLPVIKWLKAEDPEITQPWYADYASALGMFVIIKLYFNSLKRFVPGCGYYPKPSKIVLIVHPDNIKPEKWFLLRYGFKVCTGTCYLVSFIRDYETKRDWLNIVRRYGNKTLELSAKRRLNILRKLCHGGMCNLIRVDIFTTCHEGYRIRVHRHR